MKNVLKQYWKMSILNKVKKEFDAWVSEAETTGMLDFQSVSNSEGICKSNQLLLLFVTCSDSRFARRSSDYYRTGRLSSWRVLC
jgi:hypothetical protein